MHGITDTSALVTSAAATIAYAGVDDPMPNPVWLGSRSFYAGGGSPTEALINNRMTGWQLRDFNYDRIVTSVAFPRAVYVDIDVIWCNLNASAPGNVQFRLYKSAASTVTDAISSATEIGTVTDAEGGQYYMRRTRVGSNVYIGNNMTTALLLDRVAGAEAGDTVSATIAVLGILVTPVDLRRNILADDGAWCWFNEPRLVCDQSQGNLYASYVSHDGSLGVAALDVAAGTTSEFQLESKFEADDHDTPGLLVMPDGHVMAFYCTHGVTNDPIYWRKTTVAGDISAWDAAETITLTSGAKPTYPRPVLIGDRIYVFYRNEYDAHFIYSDDDGATWSATDTLINYSGTDRGYLNMVASDGRVDFLVGDVAPNDGNASLYHFYFDGTNLRKTDGTLIAAIGSDITTAGMTQVYDYTTAGSAWGWDLQLDGDGNPRVVFATLATDAHAYRYGYWSGSAWVTRAITDAGGIGGIVDRGNEPNYSPGVALLSSDTDTVYLSKLVRTQMEIWKYVTADDGVSWTGSPVTSRSWTKQVRPTTPEAHYAGAPAVAWMGGWYVGYTNFGTRILYGS